MKTVKMCDPDSGWRYGFPKPIPDTVRDVHLWLIENGYPRHLVKYWEESSFSGVPCRYWEEEISGDR
jgi:hypothetical protein